MSKQCIFSLMGREGRGREKRHVEPAFSNQKKLKEFTSLLIDLTVF